MLLIHQFMVMVMFLQYVMTVHIQPTTNAVQVRGSLNKSSTTLPYTKSCTTTRRASNTGQQLRSADILEIPLSSWGVGLPRHIFISVCTSAGVIVIIIIIIIIILCCRRRRQALSLERACGRNALSSLSNETLSTNGKQNMTVNSPSPLLNFDRRMSSPEVQFTLQDRTRNEKAFPDVIPEREVIRHDLGYHGPCPDSPTDEHQIPDPFRPISTSSFPPYASCNNKSTRQREEPFHRGADPLHENAVMSISVPDAQRHYPDLSEGKSNTFHDPASGVGHPDYVDMDGPDYAVLDGPDYSDGPDDVDVDCPVYGNTNGSDNCQDYADDDGPDLADRDCPNSSGIRIPDYGVYDEEDYAELSPVIIEKSCTLNLRNRLSYKPSRDELPYRPTEIRSSASMTRKDCFSHDSSKSNYPKQDNKGRVGIDKDRPVITKSNTFTGRVKPFEMKQFKTGRAMATFKQSTSNAELKSTQQIDKKDTECVKLDNDDIYLEPNAMVQEYERAMPQKSANSQEKTPTLPGIAFRPGVREKVEPNVMEEAQRAEDDESLYVTPNSVIPELRRAHTEKMPPRAKGKSPIMLDYRVGSPMKRKQSKPHIIGRMAAQGNDTATYVQPNAVIPEFKRAHTEKIRPRLSPNIIGPVRSEYTIGTPSFRGDEPVFMERDEPLGDASIYEEPCVMIPELKRASTERTRARFSETSSRVCPVAGLEITKDYEPRVNPAPDLYTHRDHSIPADLNICTPQDSFYDNCGFTMEEENPYYGGMATAGEPLFDVYQSINEEADIYASVLPDA